LNIKTTIFSHFAPKDVFLSHNLFPNKTKYLILTRLQEVFVGWLTIGTAFKVALCDTILIGFAIWHQAEAVQTITLFLLECILLITVWDIDISYNWTLWKTINGINILFELIAFTISFVNKSIVIKDGSKSRCNEEHWFVTHFL
jgi:hypothetical protein